MSFRLSVSPKRRAAARFVSTVRRSLQRALAQRPAVSRSEIAAALEVHRSVVTRQLNGTADISLSRVAEIAWVLGYEPSFDLIDVTGREPGNHAPLEAVTLKITATASSSSTVKRIQSELEIA